MRTRLLCCLLVSLSFFSLCDAQTVLPEKTHMIGLQNPRFNGTARDPNTGQPAWRVGFNVQYGYAISDKSAVGLQLGYDYTRVSTATTTGQTQVVGFFPFYRYYMFENRWTPYIQGAAGFRQIVGSGVPISSRQIEGYALFGLAFQLGERFSADLGVGVNGQQQFVTRAWAFTLQQQIGLNVHFGG